MKGNRNFRKKVSMVTAVICTASSLPFAALADEGAGDNFNLDGTLPIVKNADEMDPIEIAIVVPPERTVPTEDLVMVKKMVEDTADDVGIVLEKRIHGDYSDFPARVRLKATIVNRDSIKDRYGRK